MYECQSTPSLKVHWALFLRDYGIHKMINNLTKHDDVQMMKVTPAQPKEPCLVAKDGAVIAAYFADIFSFINEDVATLNMPKHWKPQAVEEGHRLQ